MKRQSSVKNRKKGWHWPSFQFVNKRALENVTLRLLREKRVKGRPRRRNSAEGGPPAESQCLLVELNGQIVLLKKTVGVNSIFIEFTYSLKGWHWPSFFYLNQLKSDLIASIKLLNTSFNLSRND